MPKVFKFEVGDRVEVIKSEYSKADGEVSDLVGKQGFIKDFLYTGNLDYKVRLEGDDTDTFFFESELSKLYTPKIGDLVRLKTTDEEGIVETIDYEYKQVEVRCGVTYKVVGWNKVEIIENGEVKVEEKQGYFSELGQQVGELVDQKQLAYGDSVSKTYKLMQIFLEQYDNGDNTYTIPKSLLKHILLQVRKIDKANRIFSNPDGDLMGENPYQDDVGYSLLGMRMVEGGE